MRAMLVIAIAMLLSPLTAWGDMPPGAVQTLDGVQDAFNSADAKKVAAFWLPEGTVASAFDGSMNKGRKDIAAAYQKYFSEHPDARMGISLQSSRNATADRVTIEGIATVIGMEENDQTMSRFVATLVKQGDKWLISESMEEPFDDTFTALESLGWLVGQWEDKEAGVSNEFEWALDKKFLVRTFRRVKDGKVLYQGKQYIGSDAEDRTIRSWTFEQNGGFGEAAWQPDGEKRWVVTVVGKLPDGRRASMKQMLERVDNNHLQVQMVDIDVAGESQPNSAVVTLTRVPAPKK